VAVPAVAGDLKKSRTYKRMDRDGENCRRFALAVPRRSSRRWVSNTMAQLRATVHYEVRREDKVRRFLDRYANELDRALLGIQIERYWKDDAQFRASFTILLQATRREDVVYETLQIANTLQGGMWTVNGPHESDDLVFECFVNREMDDQPVKWAHLELAEAT